MKKNRFVFSGILLFVLTSFAVFNSSCVRNPCKNIVCQNYGTCREGACTCPSGYEGSFCQSQLNSKFIGTWQGYVRIDGQKDSNVAIIIAPGATNSQIIIYKLFNQNFDFAGEVSTTETQKFTIPQANIGPNFDYTVTGSGYQEKGKYIHVFYQITDPTGKTTTAYFEGEKFIVP